MSKSIQLVTSREGTRESEEAHPARLYYLDWIRLLATLGVFLYHSARPFMLQEWLIRNDDQSIAITLVFLVFLGSWGMPLFFFVSGTGSLFALRKRSGRQYAKERVKRLLIPFVVACVLLSPFQFYLEWLHKGWYDGPFIPLLVEDRLERITHGIGPTLFEALGSHLWFLGFLFTFSILALPLFLWLKRPSGNRLLGWLGRLGDVRGGLAFFIVPVVLSRVLFQGSYPGYTDWADFTYMFVFFVLGYVIYADKRFITAIHRDGKLAFGVGLAVTAIMLGALALGAGREWIETPGSLGFYLAWTLASVNGWCWTIAALSVGMRLLQVRNRWLDYGQEAVLPFYVFHQPIIVIIALYVVEWPAGILVKWPVIVLASFVTTLGLYHFVIRRIRPARVLFGMKSAVRPVA